MHEDIELTLESPDGIIDCRLEPVMNDADELSYSVTILYPTRVNGFSRSEIYCYNMVSEGRGVAYVFEGGDDSIHPNVMQLEAQLANAIATALKKR